MTEEQFLEINRWQKETFPNATALSKAKHLKKEIKELIEDLELNAKDKRFEYADCFLLLFGSANSDGMSYEDICNAIEEKLGICKKRKWGKPDKDGVVHHVKETLYNEDYENKQREADDIVNGFDEW